MVTRTRTKTKTMIMCFRNYTKYLTVCFLLVTMTKLTPPPPSYVERFRSVWNGAPARSSRIPEPYITHATASRHHLTSRCISSPSFAVPRQSSPLLSSHCARSTPLRSRLTMPQVPISSLVPLVHLLCCYVGLSHLCGYRILFLYFSLR